MKYEVQDKTKKWLKVSIWWNVIALALNYLFVPIINYNNGYTSGEAMIMLFFMVLFSLPLLIVDIVLYRKILKNATKGLLIAALCLSILSVLLLVKLPSILLAAMYIKIMLKEKVEE